MAGTIRHMETQQTVVTDTSGSSGSSNTSQIAEFLYHTWRLFRSSPLYRCDFSEIALKRMSKWLREQLALYTLTAHDVKTSFNVQFTMLPKFILSKNGSNVLKILVEKKKEDKNNIAYEGIFLTCGDSNIKGTDKFAYLPSLLCRGLEGTINVVNGLLQKMFDCHIAPVNLNNTAFNWLFITTILHTTSFDERDNEKIELTFEYSQQQSLSMTLELAEIRDIWNRVHDNQQKDIKDFEVEDFQDQFAHFVRNLIQVNIKAFQLTKIHSRSTVLSKPCMIKTKNDEAMIEFLRFMQRMTEFDYNNSF